MSLTLRDPLPDHTTVAVLGLGRSGVAAARLLARFGKRVVASDPDESRDAHALAATIGGEVEVILGRNAIEGVEVAVISPGIRPGLPIVDEAAAQGIPLLGEIEIAWRALDGARPVVAITGTDGKTTTTMLLAHLLEADGRAAPACGNIGTPFAETLLAVADGDAAADVFVVEVSAFQLWTCPEFAPDVLVATNIADDHADYFEGDTASYIAAKARPLHAMRAGHCAVLNDDDEVVKTWDALHPAAAGGPRVTRYTASNRLQCSGRLDGDDLVIGALRVPRSRLALPGAHNVQNALAACLAAAELGTTSTTIERALATFEAPAHRIEPVAEHLARDGHRVLWIDDSKATNAHASMAALATVQSPVVLIAGGVDKGLVLAPWLEAMRGRVAALVLTGDLTARLRREAKAAGFEFPMVEVRSMADAAVACDTLAERYRAHTILLSPGCSSFDWFSSYAERGEVFAAAARERVRALQLAPELDVTPMHVGAAPHLWRALTWAATMPPRRSTEDNIAAAKADAFLRWYCADWGRAGDDAVWTHDADGELIGAAWLRCAEPGAARGDGHATETMPELAMGVAPCWRGLGLGGALLRVLVERADARGVEETCLNVREDNPAVRLYERVGFVAVTAVTNRVGGRSLGMVRRH